MTPMGNSLWEGVQFVQKAQVGMDHPFGNTTSFLGLLWPPVVLCHPLNIRNYQKRTTIFGEGRYNKGTTLSRLFTPCPNRWNTLPGRVLEAVLRP